MPLSLEDANRIVAIAQQKAAQIGVFVTAAVVDEGGHLIALGRMDGAPPLSPQIAEAKAVGAVGVSGARPEQDLQCAEAGLASIKLEDL
jgi:uncharacterized protein GlcG (DUF336 family)